MKNADKILFGICAAGLLVRIVYFSVFNTGMTFPDEFRFYCEARSLIEENVFKCGEKYAHDMPLTAMLFSAVKVAFPGDLIAIKIFLAALSAMTIYAIAKLAEHIEGSKTAMICAGAIAMIYPFFIYYSALLLSETIFIFLLIMLFLLTFQEKNRHGWLHGLVAGLCHLTRPTLLYFMPIIWCWMAFFSKTSKKNLGIAVVTYLLVIAPWGVRNHLVLGEFHLATSGDGHTLWEGNNPWNIKGGVFNSNEHFIRSLPKTGNELEDNRIKKRNAIQFISENPTVFLSTCVKRFFRFWHFWPNAPQYSTGWYRWISLLSFVPVFVGAILYLLRSKQNREKVGLIALFVAYYTAIHAISIGSIRYRFPVEPFLITLAAAYLGRFVEMRRPNHNL